MVMDSSSLIKAMDESAATGIVGLATNGTSLASATTNGGAGDQISDLWRRENSSEPGDASESGGCDLAESFGKIKKKYPIVLPSFFFLKNQKKIFVLRSLHCSATASSGAKEPRDGGANAPRADGCVLQVRAEECRRQRALLIVSHGIGSTRELYFPENSDMPRQNNKILMC